MQKYAGRRLLVGITGASGSIYAERFLEIVRHIFPRIYVVATEAGRQVCQHELTRPNDQPFSLLRLLEGRLLDDEKQVFRVFNENDLFAPIASGSSAPSDMIIIPCSMGTLASVSHGLSGNLLERAADVVLKENRRLVIVPRETPLSVIHLQNMLTLAKMGARIIPPSPGFYGKPSTIQDMIDFVVGKVLDNLDVEHDLVRRWNSRLS